MLGRTNVADLLLTCSDGNIRNMTYSQVWGPILRIHCSSKVHTHTHTHTPWTHTRSIGQPFMLYVRWTFWFGSYTLRRRLESVITKCWFTLVWYMTATHSPQNFRFIRDEAVPEYRPRNKDNSAPGGNTRFSTEMATKRQNLRTAALMFKLGFE